IYTRYGSTKNHQPIGSRIDHIFAPSSLISSLFEASIFDSDLRTDHRIVKASFHFQLQQQIPLPPPIQRYNLKDKLNWLAYDNKINQYINSFENDPPDLEIR